MEIIIGFLVFLCAATLVLAAASMQSVRPERRRLARLADGSAAEIDLPEDESVLAKSDRGLLVRLLRPFAGKAAVEKGGVRVHPIRQRLIRAGYRRESGVVVFMGSRIILALLAPLLLIVSPLIWNLTEFQMAASLCGVAYLGYSLPGMFVNRRMRARQKEIVNGLPDALDLMVVCVEAGLGITASLDRVAKEFASSRPVMSAEFQLVTLEIRAGKSSSENSVSMQEMIMTIDRTSIEPVTVSESETIYRFHPLPESEDEKKFIEDLDGVLVVRTDHRCEILMKRFNTLPISPAIGVKLELFSITTRFRPHQPGNWLFPVEFNVQIKGRAFIFNKFEQNTIVTLSDVQLAP